MLPVSALCTFIPGYWCVATKAWEVGGVVYDLCPGYNHLPGGVVWRCCVSLIDSCTLRNAIYGDCMVSRGGPDGGDLFGHHVGLG